jgi:hypothetical protein
MRASRVVPFVIPALALAATVLLVAPRPSHADPRTKSLIDAPTRAAIERGLRYLVRIQDKEGPGAGGWRCDAGKKVNDGYEIFSDGSDVPHVGATALAVLAFLAAGHVPGRGPYGDVVERAVDFLLSRVREEGFISANHTRMYSHAFATLALAEVYGASQAPKLRESLQHAVEFTVKCQNPTGGWRYVPFTIESDMSVTVCQVVALRAARNHGIRVPQRTIDKALEYVIDSAITEDGSLGEEKGAFYYQPTTTRYNRSSFPLTAAGLTTLFQAGLYDNESVRFFVEKNGLSKRPPPRIDDCVAFMRRHYPYVFKEHSKHYFYYYGNYYAAQAMYNVGAVSSTTWEAWYSMVRDDLLRLEKRVRSPEDGSEESLWESNVGPDKNAFATAVALLILSMPFDYLPVHQR